MVWNKYQSTPEQLNLDNYPEEIKEQFFDFINTVPYIKNLISENRPYAKDCPRDQDGKIIVDLLILLSLKIQITLDQQLYIFRSMAVLQS